MYSFKSLEQYEVRDHKAFVVESPIESPRSEMLEKLQPHVEIDGVIYKPIGVEMKMPGTPVMVGEQIGIMVL